jgi:glutamate--cysteine ligase catalytic subunit
MWMRQFVANHPSYKHDSVVTDEIQYDLMWLIQQMANGAASIPLK